jgi:hypothetical protein
MDQATSQEDMEERTLAQTHMIQTPPEAKVVSEVPVQAQLADLLAAWEETQMIPTDPAQVPLEVRQEVMEQATQMTIPPELAIRLEDMAAVTTTILMAQAIQETPKANLVTALPASCWRRLAASSRTRACNRRDRLSVPLLGMMITRVATLVAVETTEVVTTITTISSQRLVMTVRCDGFLF